VNVEYRASTEVRLKPSPVVFYSGSRIIWDCGILRVTGPFRAAEFFGSVLSRDEILLSSWASRSSGIGREEQAKLDVLGLGRDSLSFCS
jgi:hypothetical protein